MKYFLGPMSKNIVDAIIEYSIRHKKTEIVFIPSRRQIEYNNGYVNNWSTKDFVTYVKNKNNNIKIERDHSGPGQGLYDDDGYISLEEDCKYMDIIHIDPWKKYPNLEEAIEWTVNMINFCYERNPSIEYEIGTEEAIRPYTIDELNIFIYSVKNNLKQNIWCKIKYCVIQCGNGLLNGSNICNFDKKKLLGMLSIVKSYNLISKEHNGDWVSVDIIRQKELLGLQCLNIAPEMGMIETSCFIDIIKNNQQHYDKIYNLCLKSEKWKKWISSDFDINMKEILILITCHYIFSTKEFIEIKDFYTDIDVNLLIKKRIFDKLLKLNYIFEKRKKCIFCEYDVMELLFEKDYNIAVSVGVSKDNLYNSSYFMPYNILICNNCNSAQNKYIGNLNIIYDNNHIDDYGITKSKKHTRFCDFIIENTDISGIIEVGSCNGILANNIISKINTQYTIIEPSFFGDKTNLNIIPDYFENIYLDKLNGNCIVMSDVFEHFYNPIDILNKLKNSSSIKYIYLNHPDFDFAIKNNINIILNSEHTFLIEHQFLFTLFEKYGFIINRNINFENFSLFLEFKRIEGNCDYIENKLININLRDNTKMFFNNIISYVNKINVYMDKNSSSIFYLWPTSWYSVFLCTMGLNYNKLTGILDNSPNKIGKYMNAYNLYCSSFDEILKSGNSNICIFICCSSNYIKELDLTNTKVNIIDVTFL